MSTIDLAHVWSSCEQNDSAIQGFGRSEETIDFDENNGFQPLQIGRIDGQYHWLLAESSEERLLIEQIGAAAFITTCKLAADAQGFASCQEGQATVRQLTTEELSHIILSMLDGAAIPGSGRQISL